MKEERKVRVIIDVLKEIIFSMLQIKNITKVYKLFDTFAINRKDIFSVSF